MTEFQLIERYFTSQEKPSWLRTGIGDDGAVLTSDPRQQVVVTDTLVENVHFFANTSAHAVGHKALAVNLSDLAAMGAEPRWVTLNLTLPEQNESWLQAFAEGFYALAEQYGVTLIGGDTTRGPLSITVTAGGYIAKGQTAVLRSGAIAGGDLCVVGALGLAALAVAKRKAGEQPSEDQANALDYPQAQVAAGLELQQYASAAIDVSDGFLADLKHIAEASSVSFCLDGNALQQMAAEQNEESAIAMFSGGDDYALLFVLSPGKQPPAWAQVVGSCVSGSAPLKLVGGPDWLHSAFDKAKNKAGYQHF